MSQEPQKIGIRTFNFCVFGSIVHFFLFANISQNMVENIKECRVREKEGLKNDFFFSIKKIY